MTLPTLPPLDLIQFEIGFGPGERTTDEAILTHQSADPPLPGRRLVSIGFDCGVVFVADTRGEFARFVPYSTQLPRAVIGSVELSPLAWHWTMERDGATQVSSRFEKLTTALDAERKMSAQDWAVWVAVKSVIVGVSKTPQADPE